MLPSVTLTTLGFAAWIVGLPLVSARRVIRNNRTYSGYSDGMQRFEALDEGELEALSDDAWSIMPIETFQKDVVMELHEAAFAIENVTEDKDVLLFVGQSPAYIHSAMACRKTRKTLLVAGSGMSRWNKQGIDKVGKSNLAGYCKHLKQLGEDEGIDLAAAASLGNIVAIDISETGNSIAAFSKIFEKCYPEFKSNQPMKFLNLAIALRGALDGFKADPDFLHMKTLLVLKHAGPMAWDEVPRLVPSWPAFNKTSNKPTWVEAPDYKSVESDELAQAFESAVLEKCGTELDGSNLEGVMQITLKTGNLTAGALRSAFNTQLCEACIAKSWEDDCFCRMR